MSSDRTIVLPEAEPPEFPMSLLAAGIPLTLLLDLAESFGPPSAQILENEHDLDPAVPWWEPAGAR